MICYLLWKRKSKARIRRIHSYIRNRRNKFQEKHKKDTGEMRQWSQDGWRGREAGGTRWSFLLACEP